jgi:hypothetical protein
MVTGLGLGIASSAHKFAAAGRTAVTATEFGDVSISSAQSEFGGASALFDGTGDYLTLQAPFDWNDVGDNLNGETYTIEFWINTARSDTRISILNLRDPANPGAGWAIEVRTGGEIQYFSPSSGNLVLRGIGALTNNTWHHVAVVRQGSSGEMFVDGVSVFTDTATNYITSTTTDLHVGRDPRSEAIDFDGYLDEFRISTVARYTSNFTPPSSAFVNDSDTIMLMHFDTDFSDDTSAPPKASGGNVTQTTVGATTYNVHEFTATDTFTVNEPIDVEYLVIAGGGSGGSTGGGGAGGLVHNIGGTLKSLTAQSYTITVGNGGSYTSGGQPGSNTTALGLTAVGGGPGLTLASGLDGGSGGGAGQSSTLFSGGAALQPSQSGESGTNGFGNSGGDNAGNAGSGGGGGAGFAGGDGGNETGGDGGDGLQLNITGTETYYAGGGAGYGDNTPGTAGLGGGGDARVGGTPGTAGTDGLGGGGGGQAPGGSGVVIIRYPA